MSSQHRTLASCSLGVNEKMKFSIVITNYNYEKFIAVAIEINQTHCHVEVIVIDDGSTDGSQQIIAGFQERVIVVSKPNGAKALR